MSRSTTDRKRCHFTARATLVAIEQKVRLLGIFTPIKERVKIRQKVGHHTPTQKLLDGLIYILAGGRSLVEVNKRVRSDCALQRAFGRDGCAQQSVSSDTLDAASCKMQRRRSISDTAQAIAMITSSSSSCWTSI